MPAQLENNSWILASKKFNGLVLSEIGKVVVTDWDVFDALFDTYTYNIAQQATLRTIKSDAFTYIFPTHF